MLALGAVLHSAPGQAQNTVPTISGTARVGHTLSADTSAITDTDGVPDSASFSYQWIRVAGSTDIPIRWATDPTYRIDGHDQGSKVKVRVSFTDNAGNSEARTSTAYPASGTIGAAYGQHCEPWNPRELWCARWTVGRYTSGVDMGIGYSPSHNAGALSTNRFQRAGATVRLNWLTRWDDNTINAGFERTAGTQPADGLLGTEDLVLEIGEGPNKTELAVATVSTRTFTIRDISALGPWSAGDTFPVKLVATNTAATGAPSISGTATSGETLTASTGTLADSDGIPAGATYTYQWASVDSGTATDISGATEATYVLKKSDEGKKVRVTVSFTDSLGNEESVASNAYPSSGNVTAALKPTFVSATVNGAELKMTYNKRLDAGSVPAAGDFAVAVATNARTLASNNPVAVAGSTVTLTLSSAATRGQAVTVAYTKPSSNPLQAVSGADADSLAATTVANITTGDATGKPAVSGTPRIGHTLYASLRNVADPDGVYTRPGSSTTLWCDRRSSAGCSFQWVLVAGTTETDIAGATAQSYRLAASEVGVGTKVKVRLTFTDRNNETETVTSEAFPSGSRTIGAAREGEIEVTSIEIGPAGNDRVWTHNEAIDVTVVLAEPVHVNSDTSKTRLFCLSGGASDEARIGTYVGGAGTSRLKFRCHHEGEATTRVAVERNSVTIEGVPARQRPPYYTIVNQSNPAAERTSSVHGVAGPTITRLGANDPGADGVWEPGSAMELKVTFSEPISVITAGGTPYARVKQIFRSGAGTTSQPVDLPYARVENTNTVVFARPAGGAPETIRIGYEMDADALRANRGVIVNSGTGAIAKPCARSAPKHDRPGRSLRVDSPRRDLVHHHDGGNAQRHRHRVRCHQELRKPRQTRR